MDPLEYSRKRPTTTLLTHRVRLGTTARTENLPPALRAELQRTIDATAGFTEHTLVLALNYGSRTEVLDAAKAYAAAVASGEIMPGDGSWESFARFLYTRDLPDPDLVIRTSGETRVSNFLLLQAAYAEFVFTPLLWPDFTKADLESAVRVYGTRERRFGRTSEQLVQPIAPEALAR